MQRGRLTDYAMIFLAVVIGVGSIALFIALGSYRFTDFGWSGAGVLLWDAFLSLVFFFQHSGMVRRPFRERLRRIADPGYHGALYTLASGVALAGVAIFWQRSDEVLLVIGGVPRYLLSALSVLAVLVFVSSAHALRSFDPLGIGPLRARVRGREFQPGPFVVRGPYRWVRHPLYACILVLFWSNPVVTADRLLFNILWTVWIVAGTFLEERDLEREFGDLYHRYQEAVPMLLPWRRPLPKTGSGS